MKDLKDIVLNFSRRCKFLSDLKNFSNLSFVFLEWKMVFSRNISRAARFKHTDLRLYCKDTKS